jgi:hypothetical protein
MEYKYQQVFCSSCGQGFGPGNEGFALCRDHSSTRAPLNFDFTFAWEIFVPIEGGHEEVPCLIGVDVGTDCLGEIEVEWVVIGFDYQPWPELEVCLAATDADEISAEAERLATERLAEQSEYNRYEHLAPQVIIA